MTALSTKNNLLFSNTFYEDLNYEVDIRINRSQHTITFLVEIVAERSSNAGDLICMCIFSWNIMINLIR